MPLLWRCKKQLRLTWSASSKILTCARSMQSVSPSCKRISNWLFVFAVNLKKISELISMWRTIYNFHLLFCQTCFHLLFLCLITERIIEECVRRSNFSSSWTSRTTKKRRCCLLWFCIIFKTKKIVSKKKKYNILPFFHPLYIKKTQCHERKKSY